MLVLTTMTSEGSYLEDETEDWLYASDGSQDAARKARRYLQSETQVEEVDRLWFSTACTKCCLSSWTGRQYWAAASDANYHVVGMTGTCNTVPKRVQKRSIEKHTVLVLRARSRSCMRISAEEVEVIRGHALVDWSFDCGNTANVVS